MSYYHRRSNQKPRRLWADSFIREKEDGTVIHSQRKYSGYGHTYYMIVGTPEGILASYGRIQTAYPPQGYGGYYPDPVEISEGLWIGYPEHSESCE